MREIQNLYTLTCVLLACVLTLWPCSFAHAQEQKNSFELSGVFLGVPDSYKFEVTVDISETVTLSRQIESNQAVSGEVNVGVPVIGGSIGRENGTSGELKSVRSETCFQQLRFTGRNSIKRIKYHKDECSVEFPKGIGFSSKKTLGRYIQHQAAYFNRNFGAENFFNKYYFYDPKRSAPDSNSWDAEPACRSYSDNNENGVRKLIRPELCSNTLVKITTAFPLSASNYDTPLISNIRYTLESPIELNGRIYDEWEILFSYSYLSLNEEMQEKFGRPVFGYLSGISLRTVVNNGKGLYASRNLKLKIDCRSVSLPCDGIVLK